jgi:hypothetical protein
VIATFAVTAAFTAVERSLIVLDPDVVGDAAVARLVGTDIGIGVGHGGLLSSGIG